MKFYSINSITPLKVWLEHDIDNSSNMSDILDYYTAHQIINISSVQQLPQENCPGFNFTFYTLIMGIISILGILGNLLSVAVLQKDRHNRVATFLLQSLAVADSLVLFISFCILSVIYALLPYLEQELVMASSIPYIVKYIHPIAYMAQCGTIWITVLLAVNRYIAIIKPFHAVAWCTLNKARLQVLTVVIFAILLNFPRFFQYNVVYIKQSEPIVALNETSIGEQSIFGVVYTNIIYTVLVLVIPLVVLLVINSRLIREFKFPKRKSKAKKVGCKIRRHPSFTRPPLPEEDNITFIMVIIIVVLIVCHTPDRIFHIYRYFFTTHRQLHCGQTLYYVSSVCNLLIVISSSCNFVIYYFLRRSFRRTLRVKVCAWTKLRTYREPPSYLEARTAPASLLGSRRNTDGGGILEDADDFTAISKRMRVGSAPCL